MALTGSRQRENNVFSPTRLPNPRPCQGPLSHAIAARTGESPGTSLRGRPFPELTVSAILLCFRNQKIQLAAAGIPVKRGVPALLLQGVHTLGDPGKFIRAESPNGLLYLFNAHGRRGEVVGLTELESVTSPASRRSSRLSWEKNRSSTGLTHPPPTVSRSALEQLWQTEWG